MSSLSNRFLLFIAWMTSLVAMGGSLYFSEVREFPPCSFCWYQRILMYPLTILLGIAYFRNDFAIRLYILPLTFLGFLIGSTQYLEQKTGIFPDVCSAAIPCSIQYINWFGFITIPFLSLTAFMIITICLLKIKK